MPGSKDFSVWFHRRSANSGAIRVIEKRLWTGQCIGFPRSQLSQVQDRYSKVRSGVYVLWGYRGNRAKPCVYVGESDETFNRLKNHDRADDKNYWEQSVVFTSKDQGLNKAHVQYIETRLVQLAQESNRVQLMNSTTPRTAPLSETDRAVAESFIGDLLDCLAVLGVDFFEPPLDVTDETTRQIKSHETSLSTTNVEADGQEDSKTIPEIPPAVEEVLSIKSKGVEAYGYEHGAKFVVRVGSQAVKTETPSALKPRFKHIPNLRKALIRKGVLKDEDDAFVFARDYHFDSPGAASNTVLGASSNGLDVWKNQNGRSLGEIRKKTAVARDSQSTSIRVEPFAVRTRYVYLKHKGVEACGYVSEDGFVVTRGSQAVGDANVTNSIPASSKRMRQRLIADSTLKREGAHYVLARDSNLISPSRAAGALLGASYNGNKYWTDENGRSLGEIQTS